MNSNRFKRLGLFFLIICLITVSFFGCKKADKDLTASLDDLSRLEYQDSENKELGDIESIIEYGSNGLVAAHYPVFDKTNIDLTNKKIINKHIEEFKKNVASSSSRDKNYISELHIDYETYSAPNNIVSVIFNILENSSYLAHPDVKIVSKTFDLSDDKEITLDNIMQGEYLEYIAQISQAYFKENAIYKDNTNESIFKEGSYPSVENYSNYILKKDSIIFKFQKYQLFSGNFGMPSVEIPYIDLKDYIKPELLQAFTGEILNKTDLDIKKKPQEEKPRHDITIIKRDIDPSKPMVALTFDDGPNKKTTIPILDTLKEFNGVGTFFVLGNRVSNNMDILERILEEGSEIGNHSYSHKELTKLSYTELSDQIVNTQNAIIKATGIKPRFVRPTYGSYNDNLKSSIGMPLILWSVDTIDWQSRNSKKVSDHVLGNVKDGDIILMHDIYESTAEAVKIMVPELVSRGYQLVTVSELFETRGETLKDGRAYFHKR